MKGHPRTDCDRCGRVAFLNEQRLCAPCVSHLQALESMRAIDACWHPQRPGKDLAHAHPDGETNGRRASGG